MYKITANPEFNPKETKKEASDLLSRAGLISKVNKDVCDCGAGDEAIRHESTCRIMVQFEESMRMASKELHHPCKLGQVVNFR
jgi:hypothetical protein